MKWKIGEYGDANISDTAEYATTHCDFKSASTTFQNDADQVNPSASSMADFVEYVDFHDELAKAEPGLKGASGERRAW